MLEFNKPKLFSVTYNFAYFSSVFLRNEKWLIRSLRKGENQNLRGNYIALHKGLIICLANRALNLSISVFGIFSLAASVFQFLTAAVTS